MRTGLDLDQDVAGVHLLVVDDIGDLLHNGVGDPGAVESRVPRRGGVRQEDLGNASVEFFPVFESGRTIRVLRIVDPLGVADQAGERRPLLRRIEDAEQQGVAIAGLVQRRQRRVLDVLWRSLD